MGTEDSVRPPTTAMRLEMLDAKMDSIIERQDAILDLVRKSQAAQLGLSNAFDKVTDGVRQIGDGQQYVTDTIRQLAVQFSEFMNNGALGKMLSGVLGGGLFGGKRRQEINDGNG